MAHFPSEVISYARQKAAELELVYNKGMQSKDCMDSFNVLQVKDLLMNRLQRRGEQKLKLDHAVLQ